ncbi:hypothetical protein CH330_01325 [candidate division WOR-3 bacterium JGI_Cruoil_03_51_56]|uniref:PEGA domain-containing protein n=1 Tax=candidate division WOR-3 bacterium JGI_Cruoil_03_51_56 TaxID=1973747 RepID=A0A235BYS6_UNCW3|nr:MAG: hypothetical protein CH330_01325 [candidate division WOR-3 bacterium JGI_Cruoil_03_51_56]
MATFGSKCEGTLFNFNISNYIGGSFFTCSTPGVAQNIKAWLHAFHFEVPTELIKIRAAIYRKSDNRLVAVTEEKTFNYKFDWQWVTFVFSSPPTLNAEEYWLVVLANWTLEDSNNNSIQVGAINGGASGQGFFKLVTYPNFPDTLAATTTDSYIRCIYCTYKPTEKPPAGKGRLYVYAVADSEEVDASFLINGQGPYNTEKTLDLTPGIYTVVGNYKGQTDKKTVTIEEGKTSIVTLTFTEMHDVTITSEPSPVDFTLNGEKQSTPFRQPLLSGSYTLVFPSSWMVGVDKYIFTQWENGSVNPSRTVTLGSPEAVNLTATYRLKQIEEAGPINQLQHKDNLRQVFGGEEDVSSENPLPVNVVEGGIPTEVLEGQVTLTGAAQQLPNETCKSVTLENPTTNAVVCMGHDNTVTLLNGYRLQPGATVSMDIDNVNKIWVIGTATEIISYVGVN